MFPSGIIYEQGKSPRKRGEVSLYPTLPVYLAYRTLQGLGGGLIAFVVISVLFTFGPMVREEIGYLMKNKNDNRFATLIESAEAQRIEEVKKETEAWGVNSYFSLVIPKIDAKANVIANVNAQEKEEYLDALEKGVAHARGTYFPGMGKNIYMFSHSTDSPLNFARYNAVFFLLDKLEPGDRIIVYFTDKKYIYEVTEKEVVGPKNTSWIANKGDRERLILQTCYPPGTTLKRLIVVAEPVV